MHGRHFFCFTEVMKSEDENRQREIATAHNIDRKALHGDSRRRRIGERVFLAEKSVDNGESAGKDVAETCEGIGR